ncbi:MAG: chemotaxis protein [Kiritimatiellae bacterium]|nr:chemotaxis protein [Kiritimatiellia bacterium]
MASQTATIEREEEEERQEILLESGTNEVELLEFVLRGQSFGVNVAKVKQIIQYEPERRSGIPEAPPSMMGVYLYREGTIPLIDLGISLHMANINRDEKPLVMVCEFNGVVCGFYIDGVRRIHRLSWADIQPMSEMLAKQSSCIISSVNIEKTEVLIVDLEHIIALLGIAGKPMEDQPVESDAVTSSMRILLAEDSNFIRTQMIQILRAGGYSNVQDYSDGQAAYDAIKDCLKKATDENRPITDFFNFVITDIEMPQMDGLTLCRLLKENPVTAGVPVAIYSSLINEQMEIKCKQVGADYHLCKPQLADLMAMIRHHLVEADA